MTKISPTSPVTTQRKSLQVFMSAMTLTNDRVKYYVKEAKERGFEDVEFIHEPLLGAWLTVNVKDYEEEFGSV